MLNYLTGIKNTLIFTMIKTRNIYNLQYFTIAPITNFFLLQHIVNMSNIELYNILPDFLVSSGNPSSILAQARLTQNRLLPLWQYEAVTGTCHIGTYREKRIAGLAVILCALFVCVQVCDSVCISMCVCVSMVLCHGKQSPN